MMSFRSQQVVKSSGFLNDGSNDPPKLRVYLNLASLVDLRADTVVPVFEGRPRYQLLLADGFEGLQLTNDDPQVSDAPIPFRGRDRTILLADADADVVRHATQGDLCRAVPARWGLGVDIKTFRLDESILTASDRCYPPIFIGTHRATITRELWRRVEITKKFHAVHFNDFSRYWCGQGFVFGDWGGTLAFIQAIFNEVGCLHGRIASPGSIQVPIGKSIASRPPQAHRQVNYLNHCKEFWTRAWRGLIRTAGPGEVFIFAPELPSSRYYCACKFPDVSGAFVGKSGRYFQPFPYKDLTRACTADAKDFVSGV
jgi:hypothetical protein